MTDDITDDDTLTLDFRRRKLIEWEKKLRESLDDRYSDSFFDLLKREIRNFNIPQKPFFDLIRGMQMDLDGKRYETFEDLYEYCYCVASSVGLMSISIFGYEDTGTEKFAEYLGIALQLTNILRDLKKDSQSGRFYLPEEDLQKFGYSVRELKENIYNHNFRRLMEYECARAKRYYELAFKNLSAKDYRKMVAALIMQNIYLKVLKKIEKINYNIFDKSARLSSFLKLYISLTIFAKHKLSKF